MGFKPPRKTALFKFEGDWAGAEVVCRLGVSTRTALRFADMEGLSGAEMITLMEDFGREVLQEWNLERDDGTAIPATPEELVSQPPDFVLLLMRKWTEVQTAVPGPLDSPSRNGSSLAEASVAMAAASESPPS